MKGMSRMEDSQKLSELRTILDPSDDSDAVLLSYLSQAKDVILNRMYPYLDYKVYSELTLPQRYEYKQIQLAAYLLNKRGAEGQTRHIENGVSRTYQGAYVPSDLLCDIMPMVGIPR